MKTWLNGVTPIKQFTFNRFLILWAFVDVASVVVFSVCTAIVELTTVGVVVFSSCFASSVVIGILLEPSETIWICCLHFTVNTRKKSPDVDYSIPNYLTILPVVSWTFSVTISSGRTVEFAIKPAVTFLTIKVC